MSKVYFIYSSLQMDRIMKANNAVGRKNVKFGKVIVNGTPKIYTDVVTNLDNIHYADYKVIASGEKSSMSYTKPIF